jgi:hypothetical protein
MNKNNFFSLLSLVASFFTKNTWACNSEEIKSLLAKYIGTNYSDKIYSLQKECSTIDWAEVNKTIKEVSQLNETSLIGTEEFIWQHNLELVPDAITQCQNLGPNINFFNCFRQYLLDDYINKSYASNNTVWTKAVPDPEFQDRVGQIKSPRANCTGTLIDSTKVLTAFHCVSRDYSEIGLYSENYEQFVYAPEEITFTLTHHRFSPSKIIKVIPLPRYFNWNIATGHDMAILELETPLEEISPLIFKSVEQFSTYSNVVISGYPMRVMSYPTQHQSRPFTAFYDHASDEIHLPFMPGLQGMSGSLLRFWDGKAWSIIGVFSAQNNGDEINLAAPVSPFVIELLKTSP